MAEEHPIPTAHRFKDLTGIRSGHLLVLRYHGFKGKDRMWWCRCDCGSEHPMLGTAINLGKRKYCSHHCPFYRQDKSRMVKTHGRHKTAEYGAWHSMRGRCLNKKDRKYPEYGAKGIRPCKGWNNPATFLADMGTRPSKSHSLDRKDGTLGYYCGHCDECLANGWPANCRWATPVEQNRNRHTTRWLTHNGETKCMTEWVQLTGIRAATINERLRRGWTIADALTIPSGRRRNGHYYQHHT